MFARISALVYHTLLDAFIGERVVRKARAPFRDLIRMHHRDAITAMIPYPLIARAIKAMKYDGDRSRLDEMAETLCIGLAALIERITDDPKAIIICAIPSSAARRARFGFSQTDRLMEALERAWSRDFDHTDVRFATGIISCCELGLDGRQAGRDRAGRHAHARGRFQIHADAAAQISGKHVIVIDDVLATGATMNAALSILESAGAASATGLCLAWSVKGNMLDSMYRRRG
jgi:predicted amidophosphoribosyltransferase